MKNKIETFESLMETFRYRHDLRTIFDDLLTMSICAFSQNYGTGKSFHEDLYLETIRKYPKDEANKFPKLLGSLIAEMENRLDDSLGNDVLGDYYGTHLYRKGAAQYFTPWNVCLFMAQCVGDVNKKHEVMDEPLRIADPCCGSGRMLLASHRVHGSAHEYYGIDIDAMCVKMAAINLFLNGIFNSEVMCADALSREDYKFSYRISKFPLGIYRIDEKEKSMLWHLCKNSFKKDTPEVKNDLSLPSDVRGENPYIQGTQLTFF